MNRWRIIVLFLYGLQVSAENSQHLIQRIDQARSSVSQAEVYQRKLVDQVQRLNKRIKDTSTQRATINEKMLDSQGDSQELAFEVREWETKVREQRIKIGKYLGQIYQMQNPNPMTFLFSGQSAGEIERNMKFLKLISERDHKFFIEYQKNLIEAKTARANLKLEVRRLLQLRKDVIAKENDLVDQQRRKAQLIKTAMEDRENGLKTLKKLRSRLPEIDRKIEIAIFEKRGSLIPPLPALPQQTYGTQFDPTYRVKLLHLGWTYDNLIRQPVRAVFGGRVSFAGRLPGYGITVILDHGDHYYSFYTNNDKALAFQGEEIFEGQAVAQSSQHLYFELRHFSNPLDPEKWIDPHLTSEMAMNQQGAVGVGQ